mgnify:CR=1 FL=1
MRDRKKVISISLIIILILVVTLGISYAIFNFLGVGSKNQVAITGDIYMHYNGSDTITLTNMVPMSESEALARTDNVFNFTITGKNTSNKDIYYGIYLEEGAEQAGKTRIKPNDVMVYLESDGDKLVNSLRYQDFTNHIYVDMIPANTTNEISKNYSLRVWLREGIIVSDTESNASYTTEEWANAYLSLKVRVDGNLESMNMPLMVENNETFVENNKAYLIVNLKNYENPDEEDEILTENDEMKLEISGTNSDVEFSYKDSLGNEVTDTTDTLTLNYSLNRKTSVEVQVYVIPKNDANSNTDVTVKLTKNDTETYQIIKNMDIMGNNYCLNNGFNKLGDCILVSEHQVDNVETAKTQIEDKGYPNLNDTAPSYTYVEQLTQNVSNAYTGDSGYRYMFATGYEFNQETGGFKLTGEVITDILSDTYLNYYTCGSDYVGSYGTNCQTVYKILGTDENLQRITLADVTTHKIASSIRSEQGLYAVEDDYGDSYIYRGDVENNNVYFAGFYWKIIRMNGDGSIRLIYSGTTPDATGNAAIINNTAYQYNSKYADPTYAGYMYGKDFSFQTSSELIYRNIQALTTYYFGSDYEFDEETETFKLSGSITSGTFSEMQDNFSSYPYTCMNTNSTDSCQVILKVDSYVSETSVQAEYISYSSNSYENTLTNDNDSTVKTVIDNWYETNIVGKTDSASNLLTNYIVDGTFCNDRTFASNNNGNGYSLVPGTNYSAYEKLYSDANKTATLKCSQESNKFSTTTSRGNSDLTYPIALITADEVALAGATQNLINENYYLNTNVYFWTMTPSRFESAYGSVSIFAIHYNGNLVEYGHARYTYGIRPVINIRSDVLISQGDGTIENPFVLTLN